MHDNKGHIAIQLRQKKMTEKKEEAAVAVKRSRMAAALSAVTIEPMVATFSMAVSMVSVVQQQLIIYKTCMQPEFGLDQEFCENINDNTNSSGYTDDVEPEVGRYNVAKSVVEHVIPIFLSFYLGAWTDNFGRKRLLMLTSFGQLVGAGFGLVNAFYIEWSKEVFLFTTLLPVVLTGGSLGSSLAMSSFIADNSSSKGRTVRLALVSVSIFAGIPVGLIGGAWLYNHGGYVWVYGANVALVGLTFLLYVARLWNFEESVVKRRREKIAKGENVPMTTFKSMLHPKHIVDSVKTTFRKRPDHKRTVLLALLVNMLLLILPAYGEMVFMYLYTVRVYNWSVGQFSASAVVYSVANTVGLITVIPGFHRCGVSDAVLLFFGTTIQIVTRLIWGFSYEPWMFYLGAAVNFTDGCVSPTIRAMMSRCVTPGDLGKVFAILGSTEALVPIIAANIYNPLYQATKDSAVPGAAFLFSASFLLIPLGLTLMIIVLLKGGHIEQATAAAEEKGEEEATTPASDKDKSAKNGGRRTGLRRNVSFHPDDTSKEMVAIYSYADTAGKWL